VIEAAFLRIGGEVAQGKTKPADAAKTLFSEAKAAFAG
jgi:multiple sugar transport system substrate-binding protein